MPSAAERIISTWPTLPPPTTFGSSQVSFGTPRAWWRQRDEQLSEAADTIQWYALFISVRRLCLLYSNLEKNTGENQLTLATCKKV